MRKYDYFIGSMKAHAHYERSWMLRALSVIVGDVGSGNVQWALRQTPTGVEVCVPHGEGWEWELLEGVKPYEIPFIYHDACGPIKAGDVENLTQDLPDGTWGDLLFNSRALVYAAGDRIPYQQGPISLGAIESIFAEQMMDNVVIGEEDPHQLYVKHWIRFGKAIGDLAGYELLVPSVTERALQAPADNASLRAQLYEENKAQLDDPVAQARMQDKLVANYVEKQLKGDPSEGFLYKKKSLNTALKRMFLIHGPEAGFNEGGRATLVKNSLSEGLDIKQYPLMVNSLRKGSYSRGALTALAGEDVDLTGRIFQNAKITPEFCGTKELFEVVIDKRRIGRYLMDQDGTVVKVTKENLGQYNGQVHGIFAPPFCKQGMGDVCAICMGDVAAAFPDSLGSMISEGPGTMMAAMMGSAHAKELKTTPLDIENFLR